MNLIKLFQHGFIVAFLLGNVIAMDQLIDPGISRSQSLSDIKEAFQLASGESRPFHIFLGALPCEAHVICLREAEELRELETGVKAPIRIFFTNPYGNLISCAKTPILSADFNIEENWDTIVEALGIASDADKFRGVIDQIYFDVSTTKAAYWNESIMLKMMVLLKGTGEIFIPDSKLYSQSTFCDVAPELTYQERLQLQRDKDQSDKPTRPYYYSFKLENCDKPPFLRGVCLTSFGVCDGKNYLTNSMSLIYDTAFQFTDAPLKFDVFNTTALYPDIGMAYRTEPLEIQQYFCINSCIRITLRK